MYGNFVALLIFVLFFPSVRAWRQGLWPFLVAVDLGAVVRVFVTGRLGSCIAKGSESPGKRGAGARAGSLLSERGTSLEARGTHAEELVLGCVLASRRSSWCWL